MTENTDLVAILDRIAANAHTQDDLDALRRALVVTGDHNVVQVGKYNIRIVDSTGIQIGDNHYAGSDAATIRAVLTQLLEGQDRQTEELALDDLAQKAADVDCRHQHGRTRGIPPHAVTDALHNRLVVLRSQCRVRPGRCLPD